MGRIAPSEILLSRSVKDDPAAQEFMNRLSSYFLTFGEEGSFDLNRAQDLLENITRSIPWPGLGLRP